MARNPRNMRYGRIREEPFETVGRAKVNMP